LISIFSFPVSKDPPQGGTLNLSSRENARSQAVSNF